MRSVEGRARGIHVPTVGYGHHLPPRHRRARHEIAHAGAVLGRLRQVARDDEGSWADAAPVRLVRRAQRDPARGVTPASSRCSARSRPWLLLLAAGFGVLFTQIAFLAHDGAHRQIFTSGKRNEWFSRVVGNLFVGLSYGWWMNKHSRHHANPNKMGKDLDIDPGAIVFTPDDAREITGRRPGGWRASTGSSSRSSTVAGLDLHIRAARRCSARRRSSTRVLEGGIARDPAHRVPGARRARRRTVVGLAFMAMQIAVFGVYMGGSFAPNHKGMPIVPRHEHRLPAPPDPDVAQHQRRLADRGRDGRAQLPDRAPPVPEHAERQPAPGAADRAGVLRDARRAYTETTLVGSYRIVLAVPPAGRASGTRTRSSARSRRSSARGERRRRARRLVR